MARKPVAHNPEAARAIRPRGVTVISILIFVEGLVLAVLSSLLLALYMVIRVAGSYPPDLVTERVTFRTLVELVAYIMLGVFSIACSVGLLRLRPWSWLLAMITRGIALAVPLYSYIRGQRELLIFASMLYSSVIVFYLNQRNVQSIFRLAQRKSDPSSIGATEGDLLEQEEAQTQQLP